MTATSTLSGEALALRFGGMAAMLLGVVCAAWIGSRVELPAALTTTDPSTLAAWAAAGFVAVNVVALGLILLLAGLRGVSLRTSARARRGALVRMTAANLLLVPFAFAVSSESVPYAEILEWYVLPPLLLGFVLVARSGIVMFRSGWKYDALTADQARAADPRPPVVYLRSFDADPQILVTGPSRASRIAGLMNYAASVSPEQEMAFLLARVGPVIAIGKPGERLPELGAARLYVGDHEWRAVVGQLMAEASLVVIRAGDTENLWWEVEQSMNRCPPNRIAILALGPEGAFPAFEQRFTSAFGTPVRPPRAADPWYMPVLRWLSPYGRNVGRILYFDESGKPHEEQLRFRLTWSGFALAAFRPYRDALQHGFQAVFSRLGLPWAPQRSLTVAVLLALSFGMFGLHHFYMGRVRKGLWYAAFCWLGLPVVLGWIDAGRLALLDDAQFRKLLKTVSPSPGRRD